ncbi:MAG TPA: hypothetical protein VFF69_00880 [Phycisphaerales bacterium]|nr:hypothetical protein [Phycisphaerales bacterium]
MLLMSRKPAAAHAATLFDPPAPARPQDAEAQDAPTRLRRWQVMERIMELNTTAPEEYLAGFSDDSLERYLAHLESMDSPRGTRWVRPGDSPAIMVRETMF